MFYLWPDEEFRSKAIAIWFQTQEVVFKSLYYKENIDKDGTEMTEYEDIGEKLNGIEMELLVEIIQLIVLMYS